MAYNPQVERPGEPAVEDGAATGRLRQTAAQPGAALDTEAGIVHPLPIPARPLTDGEKAAWPSSLIIFATASAALTWAFRADIAAAVQVWMNSATFGHAFFIVPISLFLIYRQRHRLALVQPSPAPWAALPFAMLTFVWVVGEMANAMVVKQLAFVGLWQTLCLLVLGWRVTRVLLFPLLYLYFAVPFGSTAIPILQDLTAQFVVHLLRLTGVPVFLDGYLIQIPSGRFLVAEACSGLRYLIVSVALGVLAAHLFFRTWRRRVFFVGLAIVVPIVANGIRAYGIVVLAHLRGYETAAGFDHVLYGFVFLGIVTASLLGLAVLLRDRHAPDAHTSAMPDANDRLQRPRSTPSAWPVAQAVCGSAAVGAVFLAQAWTAAANEAPAGPMPELLLPGASAPWQAAADDGADWQPTFYGHDALLQKSYRMDGDRVDLRVAYYSYQREGAEAISDKTNLVGADRQRRVLQVSRAVVQVRGQEHPYVRMLLGGRDDSYIVWYWYRVGGQNTSSRLFGKLLELKTLLGADRSASVVAIGSPISVDAQRTDALLGTFLTQYLNSDGSLVPLDRPPSSADATASP